MKKIFYVKYFESTDFPNNKTLVLFYDFLFFIKFWWIWLTLSSKVYHLQWSFTVLDPRNIIQDFKDNCLKDDNFYFGVSINQS